MAGDIEAFLRMAAERRRKAQAGGDANAPAPGQSSQPTPPTAPVNRGSGSRERERERSSAGGQVGNVGGAEGRPRRSLRENPRTPQSAGSSPESPALHSTIKTYPSDTDAASAKRGDFSTSDPYDTKESRAQARTDRANDEKRSRVGYAGDTYSNADDRTNIPEDGSRDGDQYAGSSGGQDSAGLNTAERIVRMLSQPSQIASSVLLSEILRPRSFDDWD